MCLFPIHAELNEVGKITFTREGNLRLPCSKCSECLSKRALEWSLRVQHEISCHDENTFITLTYNDDNLPNPINLKHNFKVFMDKLRKHLKRPVRYIVSHEYGSKTGRPHHHAIIFGWNPTPQKFYKTTKKGEALYTSTELESLWKKGFSSIGTANEKTAYYIADYSLKGGTFESTCPHTGELITYRDSMDCSKRPAIGLNFLKDNAIQLVNTGKILPRYYLKKLKELNPSLHEHYENERLLLLRSRGSHEILAKYTIDQQKLQQAPSELRSTLENSQESTWTKKDLKYNRDEYHRIKTKDEK